MKSLLIDDTRDIHCDVTARNPEAARAVLASKMGFDVVYFDHDLGCRETGLDVLRWMLHKQFIRPPKIVLVTSNPVGLRNMEAELDASGYKRCWGVGGSVWTDDAASCI